MSTTSDNITSGTSRGHSGIWAKLYVSKSNLAQNFAPNSEHCIRCLRPGEIISGWHYHVGDSISENQSVTMSLPLPDLHQESPTSQVSLPGKTKSCCWVDGLMTIPLSWTDHYLLGFRLREILGLCRGVFSSWRVVGRWKINWWKEDTIGANYLYRGKLKCPEGAGELLQHPCTFWKHNNVESLKSRAQYW